MLATVKGYFYGSHIVLDPSIKFQNGQEVIVTYSIIQSVPNKAPQDLLV